MLRSQQPQIFDTQSVISVITKGGTVLNPSMISHNEFSQPPSTNRNEQSSNQRGTEKYKIRNKNGMKGMAYQSPTSRNRIIAEQAVDVDHASTKSQKSFKSP